MFQQAKATHVPAVAHTRLGVVGMLNMEDGMCSVCVPPIVQFNFYDIRTVRALNNQGYFSEWHAVNCTVFHAKWLSVVASVLSCSSNINITGGPLKINICLMLDGMRFPTGQQSF